VVGQKGLVIGNQLLETGRKTNSQFPVTNNQVESEARKCLVKTARTQLFVREKTGHNDGAEILKYLKPLGFKEGTPYCGAFLNWVFIQCGVKHHVIAPAAAYHWMKEPSRRLWNMGRPVAKTAPQQGDVAVFNWRKRYHCELVIEWVDDEDEEDFMTIGANTSAIKGDGSGEGVHRKIRPKDIAVVSRVLGQ